MAKEKPKKYNTFLQLYGPSWVDAGSFTGMAKYISYAATLGIDTIWISGILKSPWDDRGYDVSDFCAIDPRYGTMEDFRAFIDIVHGYGMKVIIDFIPCHSSIQHPWFKEHKEYYCWSDTDLPGFKNLFDGGSAWERCVEYGKYFLHLFHKNQASFNVFPNNSAKPDPDLVCHLKGIVAFWLNFGVDGFRIDAIQAANVDLNRSSMSFEDLLFGKRAIDFINAIFPSKESHPLLVAEIFDPTFGEIINYYSENTAIDFFDNIMLKQSTIEKPSEYPSNLQKSAAHKKTIISLESHDSGRFNYSCFGPIWGVYKALLAKPKAFCFFQGEELGLENPTMSDQEMAQLDAQFAMQYQRLIAAGGDNQQAIEEARRKSRAYNRESANRILKAYDDRDEATIRNLDLVKLCLAAWRS